MRWVYAAPGLGAGEGPGGVRGIAGTPGCGNATFQAVQPFLALGSLLTQYLGHDVPEPKDELALQRTQDIG